MAITIIVTIGALLPGTSLGPPSWRAGPWAGEGYLHRLEEERELLERRVRRLEQELADLRQAMRPAESRGEQR